MQFFSGSKKNPEQLWDNRQTGLVIAPRLQETCVVDMWGFSCCTLNWQCHREMISPLLCVQRWFWKLKSHFSREQKQFAMAILLCRWVNGAVCASLFWLSEGQSFSIWCRKLIDKAGRRWSHSALHISASHCFRLGHWPCTPMGKVKLSWHSDTVSHRPFQLGACLHPTLKWPHHACCLLVFCLVFLMQARKNCREK